LRPPIDSLYFGALFLAEVKASGKLTAGLELPGRERIAY